MWEAPKLRAPTVGIIRGETNYQKLSKRFRLINSGTLMITIYFIIWPNLHKRVLYTLHLEPSAQHLNTHKTVLRNT